MFSNNCASVPLVANIDGNGNNSGWGAEGSWLWIIIVIFAIFGWGGFGNGFGGNGMNGGVGSEIQRGFDNQAVVSKLDGITNGLCDGFCINWLFPISCCTICCGLPLFIICINCIGLNILTHPFSVTVKFFFAIAKIFLTARVCQIFHQTCS